MSVDKTTEQVSIRFTLTLENGHSATTSVTGDQFGYTPGEREIMPAIEAALKGALRGEKRQLTLSAKDDPNSRLDITRLARILGHPGETMILEVEIL
jgi:FKBP-type peptidyl-prolyl cis-trans isomerase 2